MKISIIYQNNRQVQRNINRFPDNYCFQLTEEENKNLRCQFVISSSNANYGGRRYTPYVFKEYGIKLSYENDIYFVKDNEGRITKFDKNLNKIIK